MTNPPEAWIIIAAFVLDLILGDPEWLPHPIRGIGKAITWSENRWRSWTSSEFWGGACLTVSLVLFVWLASLLFLWIMKFFGDAFYWIGCTVIIYYCVSVRSLAREALSVHRELAPGDLQAARKKLARIVGRDTEKLDYGGVVRATVETVSENYVDGALSPLFFALIGGAPAALAYKAINTLDSMVGYKNERYRRFGTFPARVDDLANYIPARLSPVFIFLASLVLKKHPIAAIKVCIRDGKKHNSPNSGIPEAAFSGALNIQLGGPNLYGGVLVEKPFIGNEGGVVERRLIPEAVNLMVLSSWLAMVSAVGLVFIMK